MIAAFFAVTLYTTNGCGGGSGSPTSPNNSSLQGSVLTGGGAPIAKASLSLTQGSHTLTTTTDAAGMYGFSGFIPGDARLDVTATGYLPFSTTLTLGPGANSYYVRLQAAP